MATPADLTARERIVATTAVLMCTRGFAAASLRDIVEQAGAPRGSLQHYFPGGKDQLAVEALRSGATAVGTIIDGAFLRTRSLDGALRQFFEHAVARLEEFSFERGCPIATVALERAGADDEISRACAAAFQDWTDRFERGYRAAGLGPKDARRLAGLTLAQYEGALMVARVIRSTEPMKQAGVLIRGLAAEALAAVADPT